MVKGILVHYIFELIYYTVAAHSIHTTLFQNPLFKLTQGRPNSSIYLIHFVILFYKQNLQNTKYMILIGKYLLKKYYVFELSIFFFLIFSNFYLRNDKFQKRPISFKIDQRIRKKYSKKRSVSFRRRDQAIRFVFQATVPESGC